MTKIFKFYHINSIYWGRVPTSNTSSLESYMRQAAKVLLFG